MAEDGARRRTGGRSARVRKDVLAATLELIRSEGVDQTTVAKVAAAAGVNPTSIYRRWGSREHLILDAVTNEPERALSLPDTGSLIGDLTAYLTSVNEYLSSPHGTALERAMADAAESPQMWDEHERYVHLRLPQFKAMLDRAQHRGEIASHPDARRIHEIAIAPFQVRALMHEGFDPNLPGDVAAMVAAGLMHPLETDG